MTTLHPRGHLTFKHWDVRWHTQPDGRINMVAYCGAKQMESMLMKDLAAFEQWVDETERQMNTPIRTPEDREHEYQVKQLIFRQIRLKNMESDAPQA
jgi:hypothetical protein